ncbi:GumC family protein [Botrimarina hoheduenensis]|uniref:Tyrosine kinase n=1 Tax=Botrimarina hoheduenensis TaxID=2528000 RepID=A0A5C5WCT2_9BACT|nr:Wzz/FepE/Etk N-terminal domain-containing protein [Botrimarina hoheduenensis]TWT48716.1 tyrosine kinase [Botrimarina hoheduenensis]
MNAKPFSIASIVEALFRHKWLVLILPTVIIGMGIAVALFAARSYRSEAKLFLQVGRESVGIDPTAQTGQQMISLQQQGRDAEVVSAIDLITSRGVRSEVVERLGADLILDGLMPSEEEVEKPAPNPIVAAVSGVLGNVMSTLKSIDPISDEEEALIELGENLVLDSERDSSIITVSYSSKSPAAAKHILQTLLDCYQDEHLRVHRNSGSRAFFQEQEQLLRAQLDESLERLRRAKTDLGVASIDTRRTNLENQLQSIQMSTYQAQAERAQAAASLADAQRQLGVVPERLVSSTKEIPNQGADLLRDQLYGLQVRQADLKARYNESHPLVLAIAEQVASAEKVASAESDVREETVSDINPIHRELNLSAKQRENALAGLNARLEALRDQEAAIVKDLEKLNADEVLLAQLERDKTLMSNKYFQYAENLEQARIDEALEDNRVSSVSIAQKPTFTEKPASPSKLLVALGSLAMAFGLTAASILGLEQLDDRVRQARVVSEETGLPVLTTIPQSAVHGRVLTS